MIRIDAGNVWKILQNLRKAFLYHETDHECFLDNTLLSVWCTDEIINSLAEKLKLNTTTITPNKTVSYKTLQIAVEMFAYVNYCPPKVLSFMAYLFKTHHPKEIILAVTKEIHDTKITAEKQNLIQILEKIMNTLNINHYEKVQILTKGKCYEKARFVNCTRKKYVSKHVCDGSKN